MGLRVELHDDGADHQANAGVGSTDVAKVGSMSEDETSRGRQIEAGLWADCDYERAQRKRARWVIVACGTLLASIMGFNAWLVWLIWLQ